MWPFRSKKLSEQEQGAIKRIYYLIEKLLKERKKWETYHLPEIPSFGPFGVDIPFEQQYREREFAKKSRTRLKEIRSKCKNICSRFISYLEDVINVIKRKTGTQLKLEMDSITYNMKKELSEAIGSEQIENFRNFYKSNFVAALKYKREMEKLLELAKTNEQAFIQWLERESLPTRSNFVATFIESLEKSILNWKNDIPFRKHFREVLNFRKFLESEIISEYERIIGMITTTI